MRFKLKNGLIWIPVTIDYEGEKINIEECILDTGSASTAIDMDFVNFNYEKPAFFKRLYGLGGGTQEVVCQKINNLVIDRLEIKNVEIEFGNFESNLGIRAFIGLDILSQFNIKLNFSDNEIELIKIT